MTTAPSTASDIKSVVREKYGAIAQKAGKRAGKGGGCGTSCCGDGALDMIGGAYAAVDGYVADADLALGCGLPTQHAGIAKVTLP